MGPKDPRGKGSNMKIRTRSLAGTQTELLWREQEKRGWQDPHLNEKAPADQESHTEPVKTRRRGAQGCEHKTPHWEPWSRAGREGFSFCPCQTPPSAWKVGVGMERQCGQQWEKRWRSETTSF